MNRIFLLAFGCVALAAASYGQSPAQPTRTQRFLPVGVFGASSPAFDKAPGVIKTVVGYCGGTEPNPTYKLVTSEKTNYRESIEITYEPAKISYEQLLDIYWRQIDPTQPTANSQISDRVIAPQSFMATPRKRKLPRLAKEKLTRSGKFKKPIVTEILPAMKFWAAEDYHQKYYRQNPERFEAFEEGSGRVSFKKDKWGGEQ